MAKRPTKKAPSKTRATPQAKSAALKGPTDEVKRALPAKRQAKRSTAKKRGGRKTSPAPAPLNPFTAMMDTQIQIAGALMRMSPLGLFLRGPDAAKRTRSKTRAR